MLAIVFSLLAMVSTLAGGYVATRAKRRIHLLMGFGAGVLLGAVFFDLLPESLSLAAGQGWNFRVILGIVIGGFLLFYLTERILILHACPEGDCENEVHQHIGKFSTVGLIAHSLLDGVAIGAASLVSWQTGMLVAVAVIAHDSSDGLNTILLVTHGEKAKRGDIIFLVLDAVAPVGGAILALFILPGFCIGLFPLHLDQRPPPRSPSPLTQHRRRRRDRRRHCNDRHRRPADR